MAVLIPRLGATRFDSAGEQRLAERLIEKLEDNAIVWHNVPVGPKASHPDFLILHPQRGLLLLEVKDWRIDTIARADRIDFELITSRGIVKTANPIEQARQYMFGVKDLLERDPLLQCPPNSAFAGRLSASFGFGVVFPNITRKQFDATDLCEVIPASKLICRDEMSESTDAEWFRTALWQMTSPRLGPPLSLPQVDRIRALIFPELVIRARQRELFEERDDTPGSDRLIHLMDLHQEQLARNLGEGHRIIRGVAGSGKTMLLTFRAEHLAKVATRPILVLCYNGALAAMLEAQMQDRSIEDRVQVHTFHRWCRRMLAQYDVEMPDESTFPKKDDYFAAVVERLISAADRGHVPLGQYEAVLIDEAHDFEHSWLQLAARMVHPDTRSLLIVHDNAQSIYGKQRPVWSRLGIEAKGRTTVMRVNYRNTQEICGLAKGFASEILAEPYVDDGDDSGAILPETSGRRGIEPVVRKRVNATDEANAAVEWLLERHRGGYAWRDMAVLAPGKRNWRDPLARACQRERIPIQMMLGERGAGFDFSTDQVHVMTLHAVKGLEFPAVAVVGIGDLPWKQQSLDDAARLVYVAMTRATHALSISYSKPSALVERLVAV